MVLQSLAVKLPGTKLLGNLRLSGIRVLPVVSLVPHRLGLMIPSL